MQIKAVIEDKPAKPVKKKRVMSEAQLERLRIGREKGLAKRRAKALENKEVKDLTEKKKKKDIQKLRAEVNEEPAPAPAPLPSVPAPTPKKTINSLEDIPADLLVQLQEKAIEGYDTKRKQRKQKKKEEEDKLNKNQVHRHIVQNALNPAQPRYGEVGYWNDCF